MLALLGFFRRRRKLGTPAELADFIDANAAFLMQKGLYEYSRARAGHYAKVLMVDPGFLAAVEESRWRAYPLGLALIAEMVEGVLRPYAKDNAREMLDILRGIVLSVFDRYQVPPPLGPEAWHSARAELAQRLDRIATHPPKRVMDIPVPLAETYWSYMPVHEKLRTRDLPTTTSYLRVSMCNIHDELMDRMDPAAMAEKLRAEKVREFA